MSVKVRKYVSSIGANILVITRRLPSNIVVPTFGISNIVVTIKEKLASLNQLKADGLLPTFHLQKYNHKLSIEPI